MTATNKELKPGAEGGAKVDNKVDNNAELGAKVVKGPKKIEVNEDTLRELIESNKLLQATVDSLGSNAVAQSPGLQVRRKTRDFDYKLRKWGEDIVIGFANKGTEKRPLYIYSLYNDVTRLQEQFVDLILKGGKKVNKVDYITFLRDAEIVKARMISKVEHEDIKEYGMIPKKEMAENGYGMYETMVLVPVEVVSKSYTMTLQLPEDEGGEQLEISSEWLNL